MKIFLAVAVSAVIAGCAISPMPPSASTQAAQAEQKRDMDGILQSSVDARTKFLAEHPGSHFKTAIDAGLIQVGMHRDEVAAAGYGCDVKEESTLGTVESCRNVILDATGPIYNTSSAYYVGFDALDRVVSIQNL